MHQNKLNLHIQKINSLEDTA